MTMRLKTLTVEETARILRLSRATILRYVQSKKLEAYQAGPGCAVRIIASSVEALRKRQDRENAS